MCLRKHLKAVLALAVCLAVTGMGRAGVIVTSTFDSGAEGWSVADLNYPAVGATVPIIGTYSPTWSASGGNPGGNIGQGDPSANVFYWSAPASYLGNQSSAYGGTLAFDLAVTGRGYGWPIGFDQEDVVLVGAGHTLVYDTGFTPPAASTVSWNSFSVGLSETGWRLDSLSGAAATQSDMQATLGALTAVYIRGEFLFGLDDWGYLDNVVLSSPAVVVVPETSTIVVFILGGLALIGGRLFSRKKLSAAV